MQTESIDYIPVIWIIQIYNKYDLKTLKFFLNNIHIKNEYSWSYKLQQMIKESSDIAILYEINRVSLNLNIKIK